MSSTTSSHITRHTTSYEVTIPQMRKFCAGGCCVECRICEWVIDDAKKKSPFPGMDPWLEDYRGDVHASLTAYTRDRLQPNLPSGLKARIEEYVTVESKLDDEQWRHHFVPDVVVTEPFRLSTSEQEGSLAVMTETDAVTSAD